MKEQYGDWIKSESTGIWINQKTKEESCFHPRAIEIGNLIFKSHERLVDSVKNEQKRNKYKRSK